VCLGTADSITRPDSSPTSDNSGEFAFRLPGESCEGPEKGRKPVSRVSVDILSPISFRKQNTEKTETRTRKRAKKFFVVKRGQQTFTIFYFSFIPCPNVYRKKTRTELKLYTCTHTSGAWRSATEKDFGRGMRTIEMLFL
jgi:ABC-type sulfate transport system substrate-binding protein